MGNAVAEEQEKREMRRRGNMRVKQVCRLKMLTKLLVHGLWGEKRNITLSDSDYCRVAIYVFSKFMFFVREMYPLSNYPTESTAISSHRSFCTCCGMKAWQMESVGCICQSVVNFLVRVTSIATIPATLAPAWHHKGAKNVFRKWVEQVLDWPLALESCWLKNTKKRQGRSESLDPKERSMHLWWKK